MPAKKTPLPAPAEGKPLPSQDKTQPAPAQPVPKLAARVLREMAEEMQPGAARDALIDAARALEAQAARNRATEAKKGERVFRYQNPTDMNGPPVEVRIGTKLYDANALIMYGSAEDRKDVRITLTVRTVVAISPKGDKYATGVEGWASTANFRPNLSGYLSASDALAAALAAAHEDQIQITRALAAQTTLIAKLTQLTPALATVPGDVRITFTVDATGAVVNTANVPKEYHDLILPGAKKKATP